MGVKINGLGNLQKRLKELEKNAKSLDGSHDVPFTELFNKKFMTSSTNFSNIDEFVEKSKLDFSKMEEIDETVLDDFVISNTKFDSWDSMKGEAVQAWTSKKLGF